MDRLKFANRLLTIAIALLPLSCAAPQQHMLSLSFNSSSANSSKTEIKVALVRAKYSGVAALQQQMAQSPFGSLIEGNMPADYQIKSKYNKDYVLTLQNSISTDLEKVISAKGMKVHRSFDSMDEISYSDKKNMDLIVQPEFDFGPIVTNKRSCHPVVGCSDSGTILFAGKLKLNFIEPLSKEIIITKTLDITSLGYNNSVRYESAEGADNQLIDLLNNIYPRLLAKVEIAIDTEEVKQSLRDIQHLKEKNK
ncbi:MAG: hypothetical protein HY266_03205 [Deltaproteobacteria bacterium]|nr:hypothetical protein [Deltaproteobacteria bacterium]